MNFRLRGGWVLYSIVCSAVIGVLVAQLSFAEPAAPTWTASAPVSRSILAENLPYTIKISNPDCVSKNVYVVDTNITGHYVYNDCWITQPAGMNQSNGVGAIQVGNSSAMLVGDAYNLYRFAGDRLIRQGRSSSSWFYSMFIYDHPYRAAYEQREQGVRKWFFNNSAQSGGWSLTDPGTTNDTLTNAYATSRNGNWLVVETSWGMMRVNLATKEKLVFSGPLGLYGYGANPHFAITVSNDGRYAIVANHADRIVTLFDMSTCNTTGITGQAVAKGCGKRNLSNDIYTPTIKNVSGIQFNSTGDSITYYATTSSNASNGTYTQYLLRAPGVAEYSMDYLALGDSYTSGEGDGEGGRYYMLGTDGDGAQVPAFVVPDVPNYPYGIEKCHISLRSYPYLLARSEGMNGTSFHTVACSGADVNDVVNVKTDTQDKWAYNGHYDHLKRFDNARIVRIKSESVVNLPV